MGLTHYSISRDLKICKGTSTCSCTLPLPGEGHTPGPKKRLRESWSWAKSPQSPHLIGSQWTADDLHTVRAQPRLAGQPGARADVWVRNNASVCHWGVVALSHTSGVPPSGSPSRSLGFLMRSPFWPPPHSRVCLLSLMLHERKDLQKATPGHTYVHEVTLSCQLWTSKEFPYFPDNPKCKKNIYRFQSRVLGMQCWEEVGRHGTCLYNYSSEYVYLPTKLWSSK